MMIDHDRLRSVVEDHYAPIIKYSIENKFFEGEMRERLKQSDIDYGVKTFVRNVIDRADRISLCVEEMLLTITILTDIAVEEEQKVRLMLTGVLNRRTKWE